MTCKNTDFIIKKDLCRLFGS